METVAKCYIGFRGKRNTVIKGIRGHIGAEKKMIYLDNAATTKPNPKAVEAMLPYLYDAYGNPSAVYSLGAGARKALNQARRTIAESLNAGPEEIFFTSGGTESDNWAFQIALKRMEKKGRHIITTKIEHHGVLHTCKAWERQGYEVTYLDVDGEGFVSPESVEAAIRPDTVLVSIMFANNEVGTIEPIAEIGKLTREKGILFHTDAVQAYGHLPIDVEALGIDLLSASGHKFNGPKGVGFLYVRASVKPVTMLQGGAQESGYRGGTENVPGIVGMGKAAELAMVTMEERREKETMLRDYLIRRMLAEVESCRLSGPRDNRLPGHASFVIPGIEGESLLILLDMKGICASSGSACTTGAPESSHVLTAMGKSEAEAKGSLRLTLCAENTMEEMDTVVAAVKEIVQRLRSMTDSYRSRD